MKPGTPTETDEWLSLIHDRLEGIERALSAPASSPDKTKEVEQEKELSGRLKCDECGKEFASERALKMHKTKVHG
jgi:hypothetical protein